MQRSRSCQEGLPPFARRATQQWWPRRFASPPRWVIAATRRVSRRAQSAKEVVAGALSRHLGGQTNSAKRNKERNKISTNSCDFTRGRNPAGSSTPHGGSMPESPRRERGGGIGGGGTRRRSLESQPRSRHPETNPLRSRPGIALAPGGGGLESPSTRVGTDVAETETGEAGSGVRVSDRRQPSAHGEHDNIWAHRWHEGRVHQGRGGVAHRANEQPPIDTGRDFRSATNSRNQPDAVSGAPARPAGQD